MFALTVTKGVQDPDFFWHITAGSSSHRPRGPVHRPVQLHLVREAVDAARVAVRGAHLLAGDWPGSHRRAHRVRAFPGGDLRPPRGRARRRCAGAGPGASLRAWGVRDDPLRHAAAAGHQLAHPGRTDLVPPRGQPEHPRRFLLLVPSSSCGRTCTACTSSAWESWRSTRCSRWPAGHRCHRTRLGARDVAGVIAASMVTPAGPIGILYPLRYVEAGTGAWPTSRSGSRPTSTSRRTWPSCCSSCRRAERRPRDARLAGGALVGRGCDGAARPAQRAHRGRVRHADPGHGPRGSPAGARRTTAVRNRSRPRAQLGRRCMEFGRRARHRRRLDRGPHAARYERRIDTNLATRFPMAGVDALLPWRPMPTCSLSTAGAAT